MTGDDYTRCFICGEDREYLIQKHHLVPRRYKGSNDDENLVALCPNCHNAIERMYDDAFFTRFAAKLEPDQWDIDNLNDPDELAFGPEFPFDERVLEPDCVEDRVEALERVVTRLSVAVEELQERHESGEENSEGTDYETQGPDCLADL